MTATPDPQRFDADLPDEARLFDLLEQPERWPEDPALQAELASLLELHLALGSHASALADGLAPAPRTRWAASWSLAAAAILLVALIPAVTILQRTRTRHEERLAGFTAAQDPDNRIQPQLPLLLVLPVAVEAVLRQDRAHLVFNERLVRHRGSRKRRPQQDRGPAGKDAHAPALHHQE